VGDLVARDFGAHAVADRVGELLAAAAPTGGFSSKPIDREEFLAKVQEVLSASG
jgi:hypothetical protein